MLCQTFPLQNKDITLLFMIAPIENYVILFLFVQNYSG
jgi:hypothetical protein